MLYKVEELGVGRGEEVSLRQVPLLACHPGAGAPNFGGPGFSRGLNPLWAVPQGGVGNGCVGWRVVPDSVHVRNLDSSNEFAYLNVEGLLFSSLEAGAGGGCVALCFRLGCAVRLAIACPPRPIPERHPPGPLPWCRAISSIGQPSVAPVGPSAAASIAASRPWATDTARG